jgi:hypothetical protein
MVTQGDKQVTAKDRQVKARAKANSAEQNTSKSDRVLVLLKRPAGATLKQIIALTGWQSHSVRGFISARKKLGVHIESFKHKQQRVYRIVPDTGREQERSAK